MCPTRPIAALILALAAALVVGLGVASADDGEQAQTVTTILQPGDNFVGWVAEPIAVEDIFAEIEAAALIYRWDADSGVWRYAIRGVGGTLPRLEPGMAAGIHVGGEEPVEWERPLTPAKGLVELRSGENWVAWSGRDDWTIEKVVQGVGISLTQVRMGELVYDPLRPESSDDWPAIKRGDALRVNVNRDIRWLQPTGVLPNITFHDAAFSPSVRQQWTNLVREVVDSYAIRHGVEADSTILQDVRIIEAAYVLGVGNSSQIGIVAPGASSFNPNVKWVLVHEYFHTLQQQLSSTLGGVTPDWILEGQARLMEFEHDFIGPIEEWRPYRYVENGGCPYATLTSLTQGSPFGSANWCAYFLGAHASRALAESIEIDGHIEFWRQLAPTSIGPKGRWHSTIPWEEAFTLAFGLSPAEFYAQYESQRGRAFSATTSTSDPGSAKTVAEGYVLDGDNRGAPGVVVSFAETSKQGWRYHRHAVTDDEGYFRHEVVADERYQIQVFPETDCGYWIDETGITLSRDAAKAFAFKSTPEPSPLSLRLSSEYCRRIEGTIVSPQLGALGGVLVSVVGSNNVDSLQNQRSSNDGSFALIVPSGTYLLRAELRQFDSMTGRRDSCSVYYRVGEGTAREDLATKIRVGDSHVGGLQFEIPAAYCSTAISGRLLDADGNGVGGAEIGIAGPPHWMRGWTESDGSFTVVVPEAGHYSALSASVHGCVDDRGGERWPGRDEEGWPEIHVANSDVNGLRFQLRAGICDFSISGRLFDANSNGNGWGTSLYAERDGVVVASVQPRPDGWFTIAVSGAGTYRLRANIYGCDMYYRRGGTTTSSQQATQIRVSDADITGIEFRPLEDPASFCD